VSRHHGTDQGKSGGNRADRAAGSHSRQGTIRMNIDEPLHDTDTAMDSEPIQESAAAETRQPLADAARLQAIVEGALLAAGRPMSIAQLQELFDEAVRPDAAALREALAAVAAACEGRAFELK